MASQDGLCWVWCCVLFARFQNRHVFRRQKLPEKKTWDFWSKRWQLPCFTWQIRSLLLTDLDELLRLSWHVCTQTNEVGTAEEVPVKWYGLLDADLLRRFFVPILFGVSYSTDQPAYQLPGSCFEVLWEAYLQLIRMAHMLISYKGCSWKAEPNSTKSHEWLNDCRRKGDEEGLWSWTEWVNGGGRKRARLRPVVIEHQVGALSAQTDLEGSWLNSHFLSVGCFYTARAAGVYPACTSFYSDILFAVNVLFVPPSLAQAQRHVDAHLLIEMGEEEAIMYSQTGQLGQPLNMLKRWNLRNVVGILKLNKSVLKLDTCVWSTANLNHFSNI